MCLFSNKKLKALEKENDRLNDELLTAKKEILKLTQEKSTLLDSCFDIITEAVTDPTDRVMWLNELGRYKKEDKVKSPEKFIYILNIDENDRQLFFDNFRAIADDLDIIIDNCQFIKYDKSGINFKVVILSSKASDVNTFWQMLREVLNYDVNFTRY
jgi:hypothetical protein